MRIEPRWAWIVVVGIAVLAGCGGEDGTPEDAGPSAPTGPITTAALSAPPIQVADDLGRLVPADAVVVVHVGSPDTFVEGVRRIAGRISESVAEGVSLDAALGQMLERVPGLSPDMIDGSRPMAAALTMPSAEGAEPAPLLILPLRDADAARSSLQQAEGAPTAAFSGSYVAFSPMPGPEPQVSQTSPDIAKHLPSGGLSVRIDLAALVARYGEQAKEAAGEGFDLAARSAPPGQPDLSGLLDPMKEGFEQLLESVEQLELGVGIDGTELTLAGRLSMKEGSPLADLGTSRGDLAALAAVLPAGDPIVMLADYDLEKMMEWMRPFMDLGLLAMPEEQRSEVRAAWEKSFGLMEHLGDQMGLSMGFGESGIGGVAVYSAKDAEAYLDGWDELLEGMFGKSMADMGYTIIREEPAEIAGRKVRRYRFAFDIEKLMQATAPGVEVPPDGVAAMKSMMERMLGPDGMRMSMAEADRKLVLVMGDDALLERSLAAAGGKGRVDPALARAMALAGDHPTFVMRLEVRTLVRQVLEIVKTAMPPEMAKEVPQLGDGPSATIDLAYGVDGRVHRGALRVDVGGIADLVKTLMAAEEGPR